MVHRASVSTGTGQVCPAGGSPCGTMPIKAATTAKSSRHILFGVGPSGRVSVVFPVRKCCREDLRLCAALPRGDKVMKGRREMPPGEARGDVAGRSDPRLFHGHRASGHGAPQGLWVCGGGHRSTCGVIEGCRRFDRAGGCHRLGRHGSCRRRDPAAARAYRRAAQRCRVRRPRSNRGGPGRCGRGNGRRQRQRLRRLADGPPGRCCLRQRGGDFVRREEGRSPRPVAAVCTGTAR